MQVGKQSIIDNNIKRNRFVYNSNVNASHIEALMAKHSPRGRDVTCKVPVVHSRVFVASDSAGLVSSSDQGYLKHNVNPVSGVNASHAHVKAVVDTDKHVKQFVSSHAVVNPDYDQTSSRQGSGDIVSPAEKSVTMVTESDQIRVSRAPDVSDPTAEVISIPKVKNVTESGFGDPQMAAKVISSQGSESDFNINDKVEIKCDEIDSIGEKVQSGLLAVYDVNSSGIEDKFVNSILHVHQFSTSVETGEVNSDTYNAWRHQSDFDFGFVPLGDQILPSTKTVNEVKGKTPLEIHEIIRATRKPNFMEARIPIESQLNTEVWKKHLAGYWDSQLCELIQFGFPLDFNRSCVLNHEQGNHKSAADFPADVDAYIEEELHYGALLGPFPKHPIPEGHCSPFMTRAKPNSDRRRVIVDLSWPPGASVNAGIDKTSYLDSVFSLTFPTVDDITGQLKRLGRGALLYKIDVSRAFRHVKIDLGDYDLLGLEWQGAYVDTCVPFGTRHGSQIFQRLSNAVRYMMRQKGYAMIDYIDDYVGLGIPSVAWNSYDALTHLMRDLGLTISEKKLVPPATQVTCLGVLIDTVKGTIAIPPEKLDQINQAVFHWLDKNMASRRQLQSILGLLLYVHECVKPARIFLNRMLELLRASNGRQKILLTPDFKRDLRWFAKFLPKYNGISMYDHKKFDATLELDACLTGFGGCCGSLVYHLPIQRGHNNWTIVHLEMVNILIAMRLFQRQWASRRVLIRCDNEAVVSVLRTGRTRDPYLAACARNIWYASAASDIDVQYVHIRGLDNNIADLLSRWQGSTHQIQMLHSLVVNPVWLHVSYELLELDPQL